MRHCLLTRHQFHSNQLDGKNAFICHQRLADKSAMKNCFDLMNYSRLLPSRDLTETIPAATLKRLGAKRTVVSDRQFVR
jgi:hypothetical protein